MTAAARIPRITTPSQADNTRRGLKALTGMVDLTRTTEGKVQAKLLDLVQGRTGKA